MSKIFDSRDPEYKSPFGAAACGAAVRFAVRPGTENVTGVSLLLRREFGGTEQALPLSPSGDGRWQAVYTAPAEPDLVWYAFQFTYSDCVRPYGPHGFDDSSRWQLTVYDDSAPPPPGSAAASPIRSFRTGFVVCLCQTLPAWWETVWSIRAGTIRRYGGLTKTASSATMTFWRQSGGHHLPIRLPTEYGSGYVVSVSHF